MIWTNYVKNKKVVKKLIQYLSDVEIVSIPSLKKFLKVDIFSTVLIIDRLIRMGIVEDISSNKGMIVNKDKINLLMYYPCNITIDS